MKTVLRVSVALAAVGLCGAVATAQPAASPGETMGKADAVQADRAVYDRLLRAIREDRAALSRAYTSGVAEARARGGQPPAARRAEILALRERIDRNSVRLMLVAGRHGWPVPETSAVAPAAGPVARNDDARAKLVPPDPVISEVLSADARKLAGKLRLPVITLAAAPARKRS